jgi:hypothetical protein
MRSCTLQGISERKEPSLFADGLTVHGHVLLSDGFTCAAYLR